MKRSKLSARHTFGIGPFMGTIEADGGKRHDASEDWYWKHLRKPLLKKLAQGAHECAPNLPTFADAPEAAIRECYEHLILSVLGILQDELGALIVVIRDEDTDCD